MVRFTVIFLALLLGGCAPEPKSDPPPKPDPTIEAWYVDGTKELAALVQQAEALYRARKRDQASARILEAQPLMQKLLAVPWPTWDVAVAASALDDLYGRMLMENKHYGWARLAFQKNVARWKHWTPQSDETARRLKLAQERIADVDRLLEAQ